MSFELSGLSVDYEVPKGKERVAEEAFNQLLASFNLDTSTLTSTASTTNIESTPRINVTNSDVDIKPLELSELEEEVIVHCRVITGLNPAKEWKPIMVKLEYEVVNTIRMADLVALLMKDPKLDLPPGAYSLRVFRANATEFLDPIEMHWEKDAGRRLYRVFKGTKACRTHRLLIDLTLRSVAPAKTTKSLWRVAVHPSFPSIKDGNTMRSKDQKQPFIKKKGPLDRKSQLQIDFLKYIRFSNISLIVHSRKSCS
ncbi:unnamed protein product, partial [Mesorhabditis belari]|uniref:Uncharacterized protein n=1 Tax=Mesorhabditis belari TaxID=2138241 RepID=A0AAF3F4Z2_9BILA